MPRSFPQEHQEVVRHDVGADGPAHPTPPRHIIGVRRSSSNARQWRAYQCQYPIIVTTTIRYAAGTDHAKGSGSVA